MHGSAAFLRPLTAAAATAALVGCAQVTVTADTVVNGTARIADATTNAVEGTSDFTTNTTRRADAQTHQARLAFVSSQMEMLRRQAATGQGQHLDALAYLMDAENRAQFAEQVRSNYGAVFSEGDNAEQVLDALYAIAGKPADMQAG